jgi:DNA-binding transcriptional ArsR family regulator
MTNAEDLRYKALAHPLRRAFLRTMKQADRTLAFLARETGVSPSRAANHLRLMTEAGLVRARKQGRRRVYSLRREALREMADFLRELGEPR